MPAISCSMLERCQHKASKITTVVWKPKQKYSKNVLTLEMCFYNCSCLNVVQNTKRHKGFQIIVVCLVSSVYKVVIL